MSNIILERPEIHIPAADDLSLATRACELLDKQYPGYLWEVRLDENGGVLVIINKSLNEFLSGTYMNYGYTLHLSTVYNDPSLLCVMRAGGEILERADQPRGWWKGDAPSNIEGVKQKHQPIKGFDLKVK